MKNIAQLMIIAAVLCLAGPAHAAGGGNYVAHLAGANEVSPVDTLARGQAKFELSADGTELHYRVNVANIEAVTQAHIHVGPAGQNGGVVAFLFGFVPEGVYPNGTLAVGVITAANLVGALAGQPLSALVAELEAGNAYVNVHTLAYPGGEIRGQIK